MVKNILLKSVAVYDSAAAKYSQKQDIRITDGIIV